MEANNFLKIIAFFIIVNVFVSCNASYIHSNRAYIEQPYRYYGESGYAYMDELNTNIRDSIFSNIVYTNPKMKKTIKYFEMIDVVKNIYILKVYSGIVGDGFRDVNLIISTEYKERNLNNNVILEYYLNGQRLTTQKDVLKFSKLTKEEIEKSDCIFSEDNGVCKVNVFLK
ncbi:hypothetical protein FACS1894178_6230 [Bacteroidia bacterium]|nr:hypothetical protein FACS1894178_6230 [Bacteroidia bacterium]